MDHIWNFGKIFAAGIGALIGMFIGDINGMMYALLIFIVLDYISGVAVAFKQHQLSSEIGFWGIVKKICLLLVVGIGNVVDVFILGEGAAFRTAAIFFFLANEGISLLENFAALGVKVPEGLTGFLGRLKERE
jgi:toxin secretion/phage lysis holin